MSRAAAASHPNMIFGEMLSGSSHSGSQRDVDRLRQHIIVQLLRKLCSLMDYKPQCFLEHITLFVKMGVLDHDALLTADSAQSGASLMRALMPAPPAVFTCDTLDVPNVCVPGASAGTDLQIMPVRGCQPSNSADAWTRMVQRISRLDKDFERLELLGKGAFGEVWRCKHRIDGNEYAVKMVRFTGRGLDGAGVEEHVLREVQTWAKIEDHPKIAGYKNAWLEGDWDRPEWIERNSPLPLPPCDGSPPGAQVSSIPSDDDASDCFSLGLDDSNSSRVVFERSTELPIAEMKDVMPVAEPVQQIVAHSPKPPSGAAMNLSKLKYTGTLYIQSELCRKETLLDWLVHRNSQDADSDGKLERICGALNIFFQVMSALEHMHSKGYVHRDVKPSNILFGLDGDLRLGDFGLAKILHKASPHDRTLEWQRHADTSHTSEVGTPSYAGPEQLEGNNCGVSADIYSMGIILVELFCPMKTQMERSNIFNDLRAYGKVPESFMKDFPKLAELASRMIQHRPSKRPTAKDVLQAAAFVALEIRNLYGVGALPRSLSQLVAFAVPPALSTRSARKKSRSNSSSPKSTPKSSPTLSPKLCPFPAKLARAYCDTLGSKDCKPTDTSSDENSHVPEQGKCCDAKDASVPRGKPRTFRGCRRACTSSGLRARTISGVSWRKKLYRRGWLAGLWSARALYETSQF